MQVGGTDLEAALKSAIAGGYVAEMSGQTYTVTSPIITVGGNLMAIMLRIGIALLVLCVLSFIITGGHIR